MSETIPGGIVGHYQRYKADTGRLIKFMISTAKDLSPKSLNIIIAGKITRTKDLLQLANLISTADPPPEISRPILSLTEGVIQTRKSCAEWYSTRSNSIYHEQNGSHQYFIQILEDVLEALKQANTKYNGSRQPSIDQPSLNANKGTDSLSNMFTNLEVEEPTADELELISVTPPVSAIDAPWTSTLEHDAAAEKELALWCFFRDMKDLRSFVQATWKDYQAGEVSYLISSNVTNKAIGIMRRMAEKFSQKYVDVKDYRDTLRSLGMLPDIEERQGQVGNVSSLESIDRNCDLLCLEGASFVNAFRYDLHSGASTSTSTHMPYDPDGLAKFSAMPFAQRMRELVPEVYRMIQLDLEAFAEGDEFVQMLCKLKCGSYPPLWSAFATQVQMEVFDVLGDHTSDGVQIYRQSVEVTNRSLIEYADIRKSLEATVFDEEAFNSMQSYFKPHYKLAELLGSSGTGQTLAKRQNTAIASETTWVPALLFEKVHSFSGCHIRSQKLTTQFLSVHVGGNCPGIANDDFIILKIAYLYKAAQRYDVISEPWADMDWLIKSQSCQRDYVLEPLSSAGKKAWENNLLLSMGLPLDVIGDKDRRSVRLKNEEMGRFWRNLIKPASTDTQTFLNRFNSDDKIGLAREFPLEAILEQMADNARSKAGSKLKLEVLAGPEMLKQYRDIAIEEEQALHFDYIGFFNQCAALMAEIKRLVNMKPTAGNRFGSLGMHNTESYDLVVMGLLRDT
ncbi:hypothetical protein LTR37_017192 [Vermiconidia calcicola]|uniref:Uncharacterized protein n=1 Tax=Vermiconidia calcicola TaxID=1690605 RepID=A0ACC3MLY1_9PEZI|nr:hypothetical protein LTR37_017192 [Vermiconidia calcicola]